LDPVYWANDLFLRRRFPWRGLWQIPDGILLPGLTIWPLRALLYRRPAEPSTILVKHGSQSLRSREAAQTRAALYAPHPSDRPRSHPHHAAARLDRRSARVSRGFMAAGSPRVSAVCRRRPPSRSAHWCRCAAFRIGSCIVRVSAARCGRRRATAATRSSASPALIDFIDRRVHDFLKREARRELQKSAREYAEALGVRVKRLSIREPVERWGSCTSAGSLSFSWRLILAAAFRAATISPPTSGASRRDEPLAAVLAGGGADLPLGERAKKWLDTYGNDLHRYGSRIRARSPRRRPKATAAKRSRPSVLPY